MRAFLLTAIVLIAAAYAVSYVNAPAAAVLAALGAATAIAAWAVRPSRAAGSRS